MRPLLDTVSYQKVIIRHCHQQQIAYAIRAKQSPNLKTQIAALSDMVWQPLLDREGKTTDQQT